ncbi:hypothetical protein K438DRAFT_722034 [Mycena galopus ATCC 62051]|nr:hypothetical protein K438DRAFT_722034 [Mycena galopus ATCC 62051]
MCLFWTTVCRSSTMSYNSCTSYSLPRPVIVGSELTRSLVECCAFTIISIACSDRDRATLTPHMSHSSPGVHARMRHRSKRYIAWISSRYHRVRYPFQYSLFIPKPVVSQKSEHIFRVSSFSSGPSSARFPDSIVWILLWMPCLASVLRSRTHSPVRSRDTRSQGPAPLASIVGDRASHTVLEATPVRRQRLQVLNDVHAAR